MVAISTIYDGFEYKARAANYPGSWHNITGTDTGTSLYPLSLVVGSLVVAGGADAKAAVGVGPVAVAQGTSISSFTLSITPTNFYKGVELYIRAILNPKTTAGAGALPTNQAKTTSSVTYSTAALDGFDATSHWTPTTPTFDVNVTAIAQEVINQSNFESGDTITFIIDQNYNAGNPAQAGFMAFRANEYTTSAGLTADYLTTASFTITDVDGDDSIKSGDANILITGTGFSTPATMRIYKGTDSQVQTISSVSATEIRFDYNGSLPAASGYTLELTIDQEVVNHTITIEGAEAVGVPVETTTPASQLDGFEYVDNAGSFPGTWANVTGGASETGSFTNNIAIGVWGTTPYKHKAAIKIGPIALANSTVLQYFDLELAVANIYKAVNFSIRAVADPNVADLGSSNLITSQTLTTAVKNESSQTWINSDLTSNWAPEVNPKPVDVTPVAQEVINHANWSSGDSIWFIIDFTNIPDLQGLARLWSTESIANPATKGRYSVISGPAISSVSSNDVLELGEVGVTIVGSNLSGASNLVISKGAISEAQTISSNTAQTIIFDVTTGDIVADTGYTLAFDIAGTTYSTTIDFVEGGGVSADEAETSGDGMESGPSNPPWYGTFLESSSDDANLAFIGNSLFIGAWGSPLVYYNPCFRVGPIAAIRGQTFTTCNLVLNPSRAYKTILVQIKAVLDPTVPELSSSNLLSWQTYTSASAYIDTSLLPGVNATDTWYPTTITVNVTNIVEEVVSQAEWELDSYVQFAMSYLVTGNDGYIAFYAEEHPTERAAYLDYVTGSATNIANVNGANTVRYQSTGNTISGSQLSSATGITITMGGYSQAQTILSNTATAITFNFVRGSLGYGAAVLTVTFAGTSEPHNITILPQTGYDYVTIGTPSTGDNSFAYEASPALATGDVISYSTPSANGFDVVVDNTSVPQINGGQLVNTFNVESWVSATGVWSDSQEATFYPSDYFSANSVPLTEFEYETLSATLTVITTLPPETTPDPEEPLVQEVWTVQDDTNSGEIWQ